MARPSARVETRIACRCDEIARIREQQTVARAALQDLRRGEVLLKSFILELRSMRDRLIELVETSERNVAELRAANISDQEAA